MDKLKKAWINALFLIVTLVINTLGAVGLINGLTQKQISKMATAIKFWYLFRVVVYRYSREYCCGAH